MFRRTSSLSAVPDIAALPANTPLMSTRGIEKSFPQGAGQAFVLRRITLDIKPGEFVSIMGPSGAGKSTLLHILGMHDAAWTGEYDFMGIGLALSRHIAEAHGGALTLANRSDARGARATVRLRM